MSIKASVCLIALCLLMCGCGEERGASSAGFDQAASVALQTMKDRAGELNTTGAAMVAYVPGDATASWESRMLVVGSFITKTDANVLAIVYTKAAEMADTLKDSGSGVRPTKKGENGWKGGVIRKVPGGYVLAAFSGGKTEDDIVISQSGLAVLAHAYDPDKH